MTGYRIQVLDVPDLNASLVQSAMREVEILVSSLPDDSALLSVAEQICAVTTRGAAWIDTSTVSAQASARVAEQCEQAGVRYLRATVSGNNYMMEADSSHCHGLRSALAL